MPKPHEKLPQKAEDMLRMEAQGVDHQTILRVIFGIDGDSDLKEKNKVEQQIWRWRHHPQADAVWEDAIRTRVRKGTPKAISRIEQQMEDEGGWLANKAANDVLNLAKSIGVFTNDEKALTVKIEGSVPEIGSPDDG